MTTRIGSTLRPVMAPLAQVTEPRRESTAAPADRFERVPAASARLDAPQPTKKPWTLFVYMAADNDLEPSGKRDLAEIQRRFADVAPFANVVLLIDGAKAGDYIVKEKRGSWTDKARLVSLEREGAGKRKRTVVRELTVDPKSALGKLIAKSKGELDMTRGATLRAALLDVMKRAPSERFFLDIWSHGLGPEGVTQDNSSKVKGRAMGNEELRRAISDLPRPIDVVGFDACLMQNVGAASAVAAAGVKVMVGSEQTEPKGGWAYDRIFATLGAHAETKATVSPKQFAAAVVDTYHGPTLSTLDLRALPMLHAHLDRLGAALLEAGGHANDSIQQALDFVQRYETEDELVGDLGDFCRLLEDDPPSAKVASAAERLRTWIERHSYNMEPQDDEVAESTGLSAYLPVDIESASSRAYRKQAKTLGEAAPHWMAFVTGDAAAVA